jgi:branched-chain amino acid transport system permease protein
MNAAWSQIVVNALLTGSISLLVALSLHLIRACNGFFDLTVASVFAVAPYGVFVCLHLASGSYPIQSGIGIAACVTGVLVALSCGFLLNWFLFAPFRRKAVSGGVLLVIGWAAYMFLENFLGVLFGQDSLSIRWFSEPQPIKILGAYLTPLNVATIIIAAVLALGAVGMLRGGLSLKVRCVADNPELALLRGIHVERVRATSAMCAAMLAGTAGILQGLDTQLSPRMGFEPVLNGIAALLIGQEWGAVGVILAALGLAQLQQFVGWTWGNDWQSVCTFILVVMFLLWRGSGRAISATSGGKL